MKESKGNIEELVKIFTTIPSIDHEDMISFLDNYTPYHNKQLFESLNAYDILLDNIMKLNLETKVWTV